VATWRQEAGLTGLAGKPVLAMSKARMSSRVVFADLTAPP
jgi:hypothetical protein